VPRRGKLGNSPGDDVHLTPPEIWERVERVSGRVFDPCPHPFTVDGLTCGPWALQPGDVAYVNPPFSDLERWSRRSADHGAAGDTVVVLVPARTSQPYWTVLCSASSDIAFWTGDRDHGGKLGRRVRYLNRDGVRQAGAPFDTALFLMTTSLDHRSRFRAAFSDVATIVALRRST
jgi:hypothetical protein